MGLINTLNKLYNGLVANDGTGDDLRSGASAINGNSDVIVAAVNQLATSQGSGVKPFATKAALVAAQATLPAGTVAVVFGDATPANNTSYVWDGTTLTTAYDRLTYALGNGSGFQQVGGGRLRPVNDKNQDTLSIMDYPTASGSVPGSGGDDIAALNAAIAALPPTGGTVDLSRGIFKFLSPLTIDISKVRLVGDRATLDFSALTSWPAIRMSSSLAASGSAQYVQNPSAITGVNIYGGTKTSGSVAIHYEGATGKSASYAPLRDCSIVGFDVGIEIFSNAWNLVFDHVAFGCNTGVHMLDGGVNYGERITLIACDYSGCTTAVWNENANGDIMLYACSIDYGQIALRATKGTIYATHCHIEQNYTGRWFISESDNAKLILRDCNISLNGTFALTDWLGYASGDVRKNQIVIEGGRILGNNGLVTSPNAALFGGAGGIRARGTDCYVGGLRFPLATQNNRLSNAGFESGTMPWTLSGSVPPTQSTDTAHSGTHSLKFIPVGPAGTSTAVVNIAAKPGDVARVSYWTNRTVAANSNHFFMAGDWLDIAGNVIGTGGVARNLATDSGGWAYNAEEPICAPAGAAQLRVTFNTGAWTGTGSVVYLDDVYVECD